MVQAISITAVEWVQDKRERFDVSVDELSDQLVAQELLKRTRPAAAAGDADDDDLL